MDKLIGKEEDIEKQIININVDINNIIFVFLQQTLSGTYNRFVFFIVYNHTTIEKQMYFY